MDELYEQRCIKTRVNKKCRICDKRQILITLHWFSHSFPYIKLKALKALVDCRYGSSEWAVAELQTC